MIKLLQHPQPSKSVHVRLTIRASNPARQPKNRYDFSPYKAFKDLRLSRVVNIGS